MRFFGKIAVAALAAQCWFASTANAAVFRYDFDAVGTRNVDFAALNGSSFFGSFTFDTSLMPNDSGDFQSAFFQGPGEGPWIKSSLFAAGATPYSIVTGAAGAQSAAIFQRAFNRSDNTFTASVVNVTYEGDRFAGNYSMRISGVSNTINGIIPTEFQDVDGVPFASSWLPVGTTNGRFYSDITEQTLTYSLHQLVGFDDQSTRVEGDLTTLSITRLGSPPKDLPPQTSAPTPIQIEFGGRPFDPSKPTVVVTHGWQPGNSDPTWLEVVGNNIRGAIADPSNVNILEVYWSDAKTSGYTPAELRAATSQVAFQGKLLADALKQLPGDFEGGIQFIGHSLGTHVNAYAANALTQAGFVVDQFTILDRPFGRGVPVDSFIPKGGDVDQDIFRTLLPKGGVSFVDNYYGNGVGTLLNPQPPGVGASFGSNVVALNHLYDGASHTGVHSRYAETIAPGAVCGPDGGFGCSIVVAGTERPADQMWDPEIVRLRPAGNPLAIDPIAWLTFNCLLNPLEQSIACREGSPAYAWSDSVTFASDAAYLSFDHRWTDIGDGDWLTVHFNDALLFSFAGTAFSGDDFLNSGIISVHEFAGQTGRLLFSLNSVGASNASFSIRNILLSASNSGVPEPTSWILMLIGFSLVGYGVRRERQRV